MTIEERVTRLEQANDRYHAGWKEPDPPIDPELIRPTRDGAVTSSPIEDFFIFNQAILLGGKFIVFARKGNAVKIGKSIDGINDFVWEATNAPYGSIIYSQERNSFIASYHRWHASVYGRCTNYLAGSPDGKAWSDMAVDWSQTNGEDRNVLKDGVRFMNYIRPEPAPLPRTIGYMESNDDGYHWSTITEILKPDAQDPETLEFYEMSVIKTERGFFGLLTTYDRVSSLVNLQLTFSPDGKTGWRRLNNRKNFIERRSGIKQLFGNWSVIGSRAYIYTIENTEDHEHGGRHFSERYNILLSDLYKYI